MQDKINKRNKRIIMVLLVILVVCSGVGVMADVGNHSDYSSSSDDVINFGESTEIFRVLFEILYILFIRFGPSGFIKFLLVALIIVALVFLVMKKAGFSGKPKFVQSNNYRESQGSEKDNTVEIENKIKEHDELFSSNKFIGWSKEVFITIQDAWESRDWSKIRAFEKEEIYKLHETQLKEYIDKGRINKLEEINVNRVFFSSI